MRVVYIDSNEVSGGIFCNAVLSVNHSAWCEIANDRLKTVSIVLDSSQTPDYIFVHANFTDIPCRTLVSLIKKQAHLGNTQVIIIAEHLATKDLREFKSLEITVHMLCGRELRSLLHELLKK